MEVEQSKVDENAEVVGTLVENHRRFLAFVQRRVGNRTDAEDVLQAAILRGIAKRDSVRDMESTVAWFYRVLRNALTDHYRKRGTEARLFESGATVVEPADDSSLTGEICTCFRRLLPALPEYSEIVRRVDLDEEPVSQVAESLGITQNNATVRLHRARIALRKQLEQTCRTCATHGCLDCECKKA
jgi:RNA polymerase sigma factor (sigma-70 family)